jgi:hypothetical protein
VGKNIRRMSVAARAGAPLWLAVGCRRRSGLTSTIQGSGGLALRAGRVRLLAVVLGAFLAVAAVHVSVASAFVYWTNYGGGTGTMIGRANLDGTGANQSFIDGASGPSGAAVDGAHVYWGNYGAGAGATIGRENIDGTGANQSFVTGASGPCGVAVDGANVYWTNFTGGTIGRANLDGTGANQSFITGASSPSNVVVDPPAPPPSQHTLTVSVAGTGSGNVSGSGISCPGTCSQSYNDGTTVTLTAPAAAGSTFTGWSGACSGTGTCTLTINADKTVTATFGLAPPPVIDVPPSIGAGRLFCGVQHRGKCRGLKIKTDFSGPGNAVWQFAAYNPSPGHSSAESAKRKRVGLGTIKRTITQAGHVTIVFKLKPGAHTRRLYQQVVKLRLRTIRVTLTFTTSSGRRVIQTTNMRLKR